MVITVRLSPCFLLACATLFMGMTLHGGLLQLELRLGGVEATLQRMDRVEVALARTDAATDEQLRLSALERFNRQLLEHLHTQKHTMQTRLNAQKARLQGLEQQVEALRQTKTEDKCQYTSKYSLVNLIFEN